MNPFELINIFDLLALFSGVLIRFLVVLRHKMKEYGQEFNPDRYFDLRHVIRWFTHIFIALTGLFVLPDSLINYVPSIGEWTLFGSVVIGFAGYDMIKFFEKLVMKVLNK